MSNTILDLTTLSLSAGTHSIKVKAKGTGYRDSEFSSSVEYTVSPTVDPILENNSWATIRAVCEAGQAQNYWHVGDTKNVTGGDGSTRPVMIVDMQGLYGKHVVFQFMSLSDTGYVWDADDVNDYSASDMNTVHLAPGGDAYVAMIGTDDLGSQLTNTTFKVCKGGNNATLVDVTSKLFLPAEKEVSDTRGYSRTEEFGALTTYAYWVTHNTAADRVLKGAADNTASAWWERSPRSGDSSIVSFVGSSGNLNNYSATSTYRVAPCFAF